MKDLEKNELSSHPPAEAEPLGLNALDALGLHFGLRSDQKVKEESEFEQAIEILKGE